MSHILVEKLRNSMNRTIYCIMEVQNWYLPYRNLSIPAILTCSLVILVNILQLHKVVFYLLRGREKRRKTQRNKEYMNKWEVP
jgi:hypothetical protein